MKRIEWNVTHPPREALGSEHCATMTATSESGVSAKLNAEVIFSQETPDGLPVVALAVAFKEGDFKGRNHLVGELRNWIANYLETHL